MKIKRLISLLLTLMLLAGTAPALAADAGSRQDPLLSHSFVDSWSSAVLSHAAATGRVEEKKTEKKRGLFGLPERADRAPNTAGQ